MSLWLIGILAAVGALGAWTMARRRGRPQDQAAADSTTQIAALSVEAPPELVEQPAAPGPPAEALNVRAETLRALRELALSTTLPAVPLRLSPDDELSAQIGASLRNIVDKPNYAPRRPMQLPRLMQAINDETASRKALAQIIAGDPALAGNLLRLANSPFYRHSSEPIESLDRAVAMLGIEGLRSMIAAALLQPVFRISGGGFAKFGEITWEHSLYAAGAAEAHATLADSADPFAAQLLGLILGLATIVVFSVAQDAFLARQMRPDAVQIAALIDLHTIGVARQIAVSWELSERIDSALADQLELQQTPASALGRALRFGEFIGALAVLRSRSVVDDQTAAEVLKSIGAPAGIAERIWARMGFSAE